MDVTATSTTTPGHPLRPLLSRWLRAAALRPRVFADVRYDVRALPQATLVVLAGGLGRGLGVAPEEGWLGLIGSPAVGVVVWLLATVLVWAMAAEVLGLPCRFSELLRTLGFAAAPLVGLALCALLPPPAARVWAGIIHGGATLAFAVGVREALGVSPLRAASLCVAALGIALLLLLLAASVLLDAALLD